jgi:four helix bundle protein
LDVYQNALAAGLRVYELSKKFPAEEKYSLTDQIRRSSRSVCANIAEAWRKRRYRAAFISKLSDAEGEAAETQVHLEFAFHHRYVSRDEFLRVDDAYDRSAGEMAYPSTRTYAMNLRQRIVKWTNSSATTTSPFRRFAVSPFRYPHSFATSA